MRTLLLLPLLVLTVAAAVVCFVCFSALVLGYVAWCVGREAFCHFLLPRCTKTPYFQAVLSTTH